MDISIVVPTHKRCDLLKQCLDSIYRQEYPSADYEVIVVIDGDCPDTVDFLKAFSREKNNLRFVSQPKKGPAAARNLGAVLSRAPVVGYVDDDCILAGDWIRLTIKLHAQNTSVMAIGGLTEVKNEKATALVSQFLANGAISTMIAGKQEVIFFPTCNISFKRTLLEKEKFDELFPLPAGEDLEYFWRLYKDGHRYIYDQQMHIIHDRDTSLKAFLRQAYMYGQGNYLVQHLHKDHPLLKEIKTGDFSFFAASFLNILKIPRFTWQLGGRLIKETAYISLYKKFQIYAYFILHKIMYIAGNLSEYIRVRREAMHRSTKLVPPGLLILDITHRCNLLCNICEIRKDKPIAEFTTREVTGLIDQAIEWGVKDFCLSGGEALIRKDIFEILEHVRSRGYHIGALTNGIILSKDFLGKLKPFLEEGVLSLSISLDSLRPEVHDDIRGMKGAFERTYAALKMLSDMKRQHPRVNFNVISIILNQNLEEIPELTQVLQSLGPDSIQFQPLLANNLNMKERAQGLPYWIPEQRYHLLDKAVEFLVRFGQNNALLRNSSNNLSLVRKYFAGKLSPGDIHCRYAERTMLIANDGSATTCFDCYGNVREKKLEEIFNSPSAAKAREKVAKCQKPCLLPCFTDFPGS